MHHILVVDDEKDIRDSFENLLQKAGYSVTTAEDGVVALKIMEQKHMDLVITDIIMPKKEGVETILEIRAKHPRTKIIAMSGGGRNINAEDALQFVENLGVSKTFVKPFDRYDLLDAVNAVIKSNQEVV